MLLPGSAGRPAFRVALACAGFLVGGAQLGRAQAATPAPVQAAGIVLTPQFVVFPILTWDGGYQSKFLVACGLNVKYAAPPDARALTIAPYVAARVAVNMTILMGSSPSYAGYTGEAGLELRARLGSSVLGSVSGGVGRFATRTGFTAPEPPAFTYGAVGAGLQVMTSRRTALGYTAELWTALSGPSLHNLHHVLGLSWYLQG